VKKALALLALVTLLAACQQRAPTPIAALTSPATRGIDEDWPIPTGKYVFIERWIEVYEDSAMSVYIDFPTYRFDQDSGELRPDIVPSGWWFPLEDLAEVMVVYGRGSERSGSAGTGMNSQVFAVTGLPFTEPPKWDTDVVVTVDTVDAQGIVHLRRGSEQILLRPGESWTRDGKCAVEWGGVKSVIASKERVSNFGVLDKSRIQVVKE